MQKDNATTQRIAAFVRDCAKANAVEVIALERMSGGAVQQNWALDVDIAGGPHAGRLRLVMRIDAPARVDESLSRAEEFRVLEKVQEAGVLAPRPLWLCEDASVAGGPFFLMERLPGVAAGHRVARDAALVPDRARLAKDLAGNLARLHTITPSRVSLPFLPTRLARDDIAHMRGYLDTLPEPYPVLEWGLRWCERHAPAREETTFVHRDYRTGNYLVNEGRLAGVLDWEFCGFGNPLSDVGWLFAKCWRFGQHGYVVGGVAHPHDFLPEYEKQSGRTVTDHDLVYWQVMAHLRWAVLAHQQCDRHRSGREPSLELALTGHLISDFELEILELTEPRI